MCMGSTVFNYNLDLYITDKLLANCVHCICHQRLKSKCILLCLWCCNDVLSKVLSHCYNLNCTQKNGNSKEQKLCLSVMYTVSISFVYTLFYRFLLLSGTETPSLSTEDSFWLPNEIFANVNQHSVHVVNGTDICFVMHVLLFVN